jgi:hypothetical protein
MLFEDPCMICVGRWRTGEGVIQHLEVKIIKKGDMLEV